jgi:hypothetical protein
MRISKMLSPTLTAQKISTPTTTINMKQTSTNNNNNNNGVHFKLTVTVRDIRIRSRHHENDPVWYGDHDYDLFHARNDRIVDMMDTNARMYIEKIGECTRGLEGMTPKARKRSMLHKLSADEAVFSAQRDARLGGKKDPSRAIAKAYSRACYSSKHDAAIAGLRDEKYVKGHVTTTTTTAPASSSFMALNQVLKPDAFPNVTISPPQAKNVRDRRRRMRKLVCAAA